MTRRTLLGAFVGGGLALGGGLAISRFGGASGTGAAGTGAAGTGAAGTGAAGTGATAAAGQGMSHADGPPVTLDRAAIARVEAARARSGRPAAVRLVPQHGQVDLGGRVVDAMTYGGELPGAPLRFGAGDLVTLTVDNRLAHETSVHWHGLALRHDADGVPGVTGPALAAGSTTSVQFVAPRAGTHWLHPHTGLQLDWGLHAAVIIEDPSEKGGYDEEVVVVLDDWTVGLGRTPEELLAGLLATGSTMGGGMGGMGGMDGMGGGMGGMGGMGGTGSSGATPGPDMMAHSPYGDITYPAYLVNGRLPTAPRAVDAKPGARVRIRMVNAAADTTFDVALAGHTMTVTHSDGYPVEPVTVSSLRISMGERYDVLVTLEHGVFPLVAKPTGKTGTPGRLLVRTASGDAPPLDAEVPELTGARLTLDQLVAPDAVRLPERDPDTEQSLTLGGSMQGYHWTINGRPYATAQPLTVREGRRTRIQVVNRSMMVHPVHLHGHTFEVRTGGRPRKDTVLVPAMSAVGLDVVADNPGAWMLHCHNAFHMEAGMMTRLDYTS